MFIWRDLATCNCILVYIFIQINGDTKCQNWSKRIVLIIKFVYMFYTFPRPHLRHGFYILAMIIKRLITIDKNYIHDCIPLLFGTHKQTEVKKPFTFVVMARKVLSYIHIEKRNPKFCFALSPAIFACKLWRKSKVERKKTLIINHLAFIQN